LDSGFPGFVCSGVVFLFTEFSLHQKISCLFYFSHLRYFVAHEHTLGCLEVVIYFSLSIFNFFTTMTSPESLQDLIDKTKALRFEFPHEFLKLEVIKKLPPTQEAFALTEKILSPKPINTQALRGTLAASWSFATPLAVETLAPNKFMLGVLNPIHVEKILNEGPWNVWGSLLLLRLWSPELAIAKMKLTRCPF
jgi:hypothetical protein